MTHYASLKQLRANLSPDVAKESAAALTALRAEAAADLANAHVAAMLRTTDGAQEAAALMQAGAMGGAQVEPPQRAAYEAATIEAMHTGDYAALTAYACTVADVDDAPDLEYTPVTAPLPQLVRREELDAAKAEIEHLRADNATLRAKLDGWNTMPAEELVAYWNAYGNDDDTLGEWIGELRRGINVGRYYAGLEPL